VDVRIVAATNQDLVGMVNERRFRADLFYRLNVFPILIPPLRERPEDIPILATHFAAMFAKQMNKGLISIPDPVMNILGGYDWPGNIRELQNVIERSVIVSTGPILRLQVNELKTLRRRDSMRTLAEAERDHILEALRQVGWVVGGIHGAAILLGLPRTTLLSRMRKLGISRGSSSIAPAVGLMGGCADNSRLDRLAGGIEDMGQGFPFVGQPEQSVAVGVGKL
jgi:formate hydrogenlyase transcriptional activator